ncbi:putative NADPH-quinone reductase (modulator of drug activity B) [Methanomethylovorans hollandica DSM 15978]|uniref:Putative NADPH-quinone reductase (Modulator of drug activity B) n=1 Tax=Methanomethylovorans hollandica (strain DSM 15978 / NBRC 107637 / DMS1) TaxID=867904 RepID=L0KVU8_METHD|nr:NAD(P)H-dependent oxidoreductase [Methanomethylovorans hollandica]AGB49261.1 putative NADPH-quinone reductase (modulator of drug activity B) [Methanomethylovorans hollandica DSM 15978]
MNVLYIYAHQEPASFNAALKAVAVETFEKTGHNVKVSDLYAMHFKPVLDANDFMQRKKPEKLALFPEQINATKTGTFVADIMEEMDKVKWADLLIFQFPIYFTGMPAIMKGWLDRIFTAGFAFDPITQGVYENGLLKGKKVMMTITTGADENTYSEGGSHGDIHTLLKYITHCIFEYVGLEVLPSYIMFSVNSQSQEKGQQRLENYGEILKGL